VNGPMLRRSRFDRAVEVSGVSRRRDPARGEFVAEEILVPAPSDHSRAAEARFGIKVTALTS